MTDGQPEPEKEVGTGQEAAATQRLLTVWHKAVGAALLALVVGVSGFALRTMVQVRVSPNIRCPRHDTLRWKLCAHLALREIMTDPQRQLELVNLNDGTTDPLTYQDPECTATEPQALPYRIFRCHPRDASARSEHGALSLDVIGRRYSSLRKRPYEESAPHSASMRSELIARSVVDA